MRRKQDYIDLLEETVSYYKNNKRAINSNNQCGYYIAGNMCAVGRCLKNPDKIEYNTISVKGLCEKYPFEDLLKEKYRGFNIVFWNKIQNLHDTSNNWKNIEGESDLTDRGKCEFNSIKRWIEINIK